MCNIMLLCCDCSVYWEVAYNIADYIGLTPSPPRLIDPANPANNVWESGIHGPSWVLVDKINTVDLSLLV